LRAGVCVYGWGGGVLCKQGFAGAEVLFDLPGEVWGGGGADEEIREESRGFGKDEKLVGADDIFVVSGVGNLATALGFDDFAVGAIFHFGDEKEVVAVDLGVGISFGIGTVVERVGRKILHVDNVSDREFIAPRAYGGVLIAATQNRSVAVVSRIVLKVIVVKAKGGFDLTEVGFTGGVAGAGAGVVEVNYEHGDENADDGDDHEHFQEGET